MKSLQVADATLHFEDRGSGPVVLLVHGFPLNHAMWQPQIDALSPHYRVIAPDLRGFGRSSVTPGTVSMQQFADDLSGLLDALQIGDPITYCGLSMGGYIAWRFWEKYGHRVGRLVLCDTRATPDTPEAARARGVLAQRVLSDGPQAAVEAMLPKLLAPATRERRPELVEILRSMMLAAPPQGIAAALRGMAERHDATPLLSSIDVPVLVAVGREDAITTADEMRSLSAAIPGAEFLDVPDAGHMATLENPEAVNTALLRFLSAVR